jgi:hypothetical protein
MVFKTTPAKDLIRSKYDKGKVESLQKRLGYKLAYFGLPGEEMLDVLCWRDYIDYVTAVERKETVADAILTTAFKHCIDNRLEILRGDIDQIMLRWEDNMKRSPSRQAYEIINLDYEGGIMYKDLIGNSKRLTAIKEIIGRQANQKKDCLMFLTVNTRNRDKKEFRSAIVDILEQILQYGLERSIADRATEVLHWYADQRYDYKIKVFLPYVLEPLLADKRYVAHYHEPVTYLGSSNIRMVHFAIDMKYDETRASRTKSRALPQIVDIPFYEIRNNAFVQLWTEKIERT